MQKSPDDIIIFLLITTAIIVVMSGFVITIVLLYRKKQISHQKDIESIRSSYETTILNTQLEMQEQTFKNISKEIHDNIGMSLTLAKLNLNTLKPGETNGNEQVISSIELISKAIADLADISKSLNPDFISNYGLINAIGQEAGKVQKTGICRIKVDVTGETIFLNSQKELIVFRIIQEALNNILKHARASHISIHLHYNKDHLGLWISDDGIGILAANNNGDNRKGSGLINMKSRALMLGGSWDIDSSDKGTTIKLTVPY